MQADAKTVADYYTSRIGKAVEVDAYSSYSANIAKAGGFAGSIFEKQKTPVIFEVYSNEGRYVAAQSSIAEREFIMPPHVQFRVRDVQNSRYSDTYGKEKTAVFVVLEEIE